MKTSFTFSVLFFGLINLFNAGAQTACDISLGEVTQIYYPNTTSTPTNSGGQYLCGEKTVVYDTLPIGCIFAMVNAGSHLFVKSTCSAVHQVWVKNTGTLTIPAGGAGLFSILLEPGAVFNNLSGYPISSSTCSLITFPVVNCSSAIFTGINASSENLKNMNGIKVGPVPADNTVHLELSGSTMPVTVSLLGLGGQVVFKKEYEPAETIDVPTQTLENGFYALSVRIGNIHVTKKIIVLH